MDPVFDSSPGQQPGHAPAGPGAAPAPAASASNRPLWAAVGVLGVAVAALGGTLLWQNAHRDDGAAPQPLAAAGAPATALTREDVLAEKPATVASVAPAVAAAPAAAVAAPAPAPARPVVTAPSPAPRSGNGGGYTGSYATAAAAAPVAARAPVCADCGRIESVTPIEQAAPATGLGAVAGGVLGAVLGNQVGGGHGRTAATILGAGGGAFLGNTVEKRTRSTTTYEIRVRMDNGSVRTYNHSAPVPVGERVTVEGNGFRLGQAQTYSTHAAARDAGYRQVSEPQGSYSSSRY